MKRKPVAIAVEYLRDPDPRIRANALTALSSIGSAESITILVETAVREEDPDLRERAEELLAGLEDDEPIEHLREAVKRALEDTGTREAAYLLVSILRGRGLPVTAGFRPLTERISFAFRMRKLIYPDRDTRFRRRGLLPGFLGTLAGLFLTVAFLSGLGLLEPLVANGGGFTDYLSFSLIVSPLLAVAAVLRTTPMNLRFDRTSAVIFALSSATVGGLIFAVGSLLVVLLIGYWGDPYGMWFLEAGLVLAWIGLLAPSVRLGSILGYAHFGHRRLRMYAQTATGAIAGILVLTVPPLLVESGEIGSMARRLWLLSLPATVGVANAFTRIDEEAPSHVALVGGTGRWVVLGTITLFVLTGFAMMVGGPDGGDAGGAAPGSAAQMYGLPRDTVVTTTVPAWFGFRLMETSERVTVGAQVLDEDRGQGRDFVLALYEFDSITGKLGDPVFEGDDPPRVIGPLEPGEYMFVATFYGALRNVVERASTRRTYDDLAADEVFYRVLSRVPGSLYSAPEQPVRPSYGQSDSRIALYVGSGDEEEGLLERMSDARREEASVMREQRMNSTDINSALGIDAYLGGAVRLDAVPARLAQPS